MIKEEPSKKMYTPCYFDDNKSILFRPDNEYAYIPIIKKPIDIPNYDMPNYDDSEDGSR